MPDIDGDEVCRRLRAQEETRDLLIAHLSANVEALPRLHLERVRHHVSRAPSDDSAGFLKKPFSLKDLLSRVHQLAPVEPRGQA